MHITSLFLGVLGHSFPLLSLVQPASALPVVTTDPYDLGRPHIELLVRRASPPPVPPMGRVSPTRGRSQSPFSAPVQKSTGGDFDPITGQSVDRGRQERQLVGEDADPQNYPGHHADSGLVAPRPQPDLPRLPTAEEYQRIFERRDRLRSLRPSFPGGMPARKTGTQEMVDIQFLNRPAAMERWQNQQEAKRKLADEFYTRIEDSQRPLLRSLVPDEGAWKKHEDNMKNLQNEFKRRVADVEQQGDGQPAGYVGVLRPANSRNVFKNGP